MASVFAYWFNQLINAAECGVPSKHSGQTTIAITRQAPQSRGLITKGSDLSIELRALYASEVRRIIGNYLSFVKPNFLPVPYFNLQG